MREIKFRAYNKYTKEMVYFDDLYWFEEQSIHKNEDEGWELTQWTGQKDKKGNEIYEEDILILIEKKWICRWDNDYTKFYLKPLFHTIYEFNKQAVITENYTIIGNSFENLELLNKD